MIYSTNLLKVNLPESKYFLYWDKMRLEIESQIYNKGKDERSQNLKLIEKSVEEKIENLAKNKFLVLDFDHFLENNEENRNIGKEMENLENWLNFVLQIQRKLKNLKIFVISNYSKTDFENQLQIKTQIKTQNQDSKSSQNIGSQNIITSIAKFTFLQAEENSENPQNSKIKTLESLAIDSKVSFNEIVNLRITGKKLENEKSLQNFKNEFIKTNNLDLNLLILWKNNSTELRKQLILSLDSYLTFLTRDNILARSMRVDNRPLDKTREIKCQIGVLPHNHGSSLFSRGETQVLNVLTLGTTRDGQTLDDMENFDEEETKNYIHHYNFPSYSVGETGRYFGPGRREIGHGALAEKALLPVLPSTEKFPYTMRLVSECLGSNGSTSMASTCSSTLSLLQGGVPISDLVAGVAMGLVLANR